MLRRLYRQRRRLAVLFAALTYAVWTREGGLDGMRYALKHELHGNLTIFAVSMGLALAIVTLGAGIVVSYLAPGMRRGVEGFAIACVLSDQLLRLDTPVTNMIPDGLGAWFVFMVLYVCIVALLDSSLLYRLGLRLPLSLRASRTLDARPETIWGHVASDDGTMSADQRQYVKRVEPRPDIGPETFEVHYKMVRGVTLAQIHTRTAWDAPAHLKYSFAPADHARMGGTSNGTYEMTCTAREDGRTDVTITQHYPGLGPGAWLTMWLDDAGRDEMDSIQARVEGRRDWSTLGRSMRVVAQA